MKKNTISEFRKYVIPNVLGMLGLSCYILADTFFVSKGLGADGLAALNLAIPIYNFINGCGLMLGMGGATRYAMYRAQGNTEGARRTFANMLFAAAAAAVLFLALGLSASRTITHAIGADAAVFEMTETYLRVILCFSPAFLLNTVLLCYVRNDGNPRLSMAAMLVGSMANIVLDYIFIFPLRMGIFGAVLATGFAPVISMAILSRHTISSYRKLRFQYDKTLRLMRTRLSLHLLGDFIRIGFPSLVTEMSSGIVMMVFNGIILSLMGNIGVAAYGVIANISLVVTAIFTGIGQGIQPVISNAYGRGEEAETRIFLKYGLITAAVTGIVIYLCMGLGAAQVTAVFNSGGDAGMQQTAEAGIRIYFLSAPLAGCNIVLAMYFASVERAIPAQLLSLLRGVLLILPLVSALSLLWKMTGVWLACPVTELLTAVCGGLLLGSQMRESSHI